MKILYANGCSWTEGAEIPNTSIYPFCTSSKYYESWPFKLSQKLKVPLCINEGAGAGSNDRIYRKTQEYIIKYINSGKDPKDLLIVIGWSTCERTEVSTEDTFVRITSTSIAGPVNVMDKKLMDDLTQFQKAYYRIYDDNPNKIRNVQMMISLRMMCESYNIKYYDFIAIGPQPIEYMNISKNYYGCELKNMYHMSWNEYCETNFQSRYEFKHPAADAHNNWAEVLKDKINEL